MEPVVEVSVTSLPALSIVLDACVRLPFDVRAMLPLVAVTSLLTLILPAVDFIVTFPVFAVTLPLTVMAPSEVAFTFWFAVSLPVVCIASLDSSVISPLVVETSPPIVIAPMVEVTFTFWFAVIVVLVACVKLPFALMVTLPVFAVTLPPMVMAPSVDVAFTSLPAIIVVPAACVTSPFDVRAMLPVAVRFPLLVSVPFSRRFSTEISPVTFRLTETVSALELSLMRTSPSMAGFSSAVVSTPSTIMLLNLLSAFSNSRDLPLKVLTVSAVMAPLSVWVMFPLTAFKVSSFITSFLSTADTVPSSVSLSAAASVTLPPALTEPVTAVFPALSSSRPTAREPSLFATNSPVVLMVPRSRVPFRTPWEILPMPRI